MDKVQTEMLVRCAVVHYNCTLESAGLYKAIVGLSARQC